MFLQLNGLKMFANPAMVAIIAWIYLMGYLYQENELQINISRSLRFRMFLDERFSLALLNFI